MQRQCYCPFNKGNAIEVAFSFSNRDRYYHSKGIDNGVDISKNAGKSDFFFHFKMATQTKNAVLFQRRTLLSIRRKLFKVSAIGDRVRRQAILCWK